MGQHPGVGRAHSSWRLQEGIGFFCLFVCFRLLASRGCLHSLACGPVPSLPPLPPTSLSLKLLPPMYKGP